MDSRTYCEKCEQSFSDSQRYRRHLQSKYHNRTGANTTVMLDEFSTSAYCVSCKKQFPSTQHYRAHLKAFHKMELTPMKPTPNFNIKPDPKNARNHCDSCSWTFKSKSNFQVHLEKVHKVPIPSAPKRSSPDPNIQPDVNDPNCYCRVCRYNYKDRHGYRVHLKNIHKMELAPLNRYPSCDNSTINTQDPKNTVCPICKYKYSSRYVYQTHMKVQHRDIKIPLGKSRANPRIQPDPNDPNFYCASCQKSYKDSKNYRIHLLAIHPHLEMDRTKGRPPNSLIQEMDAGDNTNTRCTICDRTYKNRGSFMKHVYTIHRGDNRRPAVGGNQSISRSSNAASKLDDPASRYCQLCKQSFTTTGSYKRHAASKHKGQH